MWHSRKYDMSPMPYSVFYYGGYAIHGTNYVKSLGRPASHGCVRLHTSNAREFYNLVRDVGRKNTRIVVQN
jgi:lipoprotein-anchoring transpeptidase ErfK/SrfK